MTTDTKATFTAGPWRVRAGHFCDDGIPAYEVVMPGSPTVNASDARLIAAAPDLLAACQDLLKVVAAYGYTGGSAQRANAVIAKAEGR